MSAEFEGKTPEELLDLLQSQLLGIRANLLNIKKVISDGDLGETTVMPNVSYLPLVEKCWDKFAGQRGHLVFIPSKEFQK